MREIVIIGNGIAGITAARHIRKRSENKITVISSETKHFFSRTALMYVYMGHMRYENIKPYEDWFWKKNRIDLVNDHVKDISTTERVLQLESGKTIAYDILIIATGSKSNKFGWPGQDLKGVQGLYSFQDLEKMETNTENVQRAVIVGGGLIGIEMVEMLLSRKIEVTLLIRENSFWNNILPDQESRMLSKHIREHHVDLRTKTELEEILSDDNGNVKAVVTKGGAQIDCQFVGLAVGVSPNVDVLKNSGIETRRGVLVNEYLETNIPDVYAIGDCVERTYELPGRKSIEQVWYTGRMMGEVVAQTICTTKTKYEPGPWFNSAKFFDIEFQAYGNVRNELQLDEEEFYWEHDGGKKAIHFVWNKNSKIILGINVFGIRLRHEKFDRWLREQKSIHFVLQNLESANFDPELFKRHEKEIVEDFEKNMFGIKSTVA